MKTFYRLFCSAIAILTLTSGVAQITIDSLPPLEAGTSYVRYLAIGPENVDLGNAGGDQQWNWTLNDTLSYEVTIDSNDQIQLFPGASVVRETPGLKTYLGSSPDSYSVRGLVGDDPVGQGLITTSIYVPSISELYAPMMYQDSMFQSTLIYTGIPLSVVPDSVLMDLPLRPDSMRVRIELKYDDQIDAWGQLQINESDNRDVLRINRTTFIAIGVEAQISILPWVDITELLLEFVDLLPSDVSLLDTTQTYLFVAPGDNRAVAEVFLGDSIGIASIEYTQDITSGLFADNLPLVEEISIFPNPARQDFSIEVTEEMASLVLINSLGQRVIEKRNISSGIVQMNVSHLISGVYYLQARDDRGLLIGNSTIAVSH